MTAETETSDGRTASAGTPGTGRRAVRADAERTVQAILRAAERVLSTDPAATMEQIAVASGVARTTVHRRFATREALLDALSDWAARQFDAAVAAGHAETAPPLVALYQVTANVLAVKIDWNFAMNRAETPEVAEIHARVLDACDRLFRRARDAGLLRADADLTWARQVYYALIHETARSSPAGGSAADVDALATRLVDTLLRGVGADRGL